MYLPRALTTLLSLAAAAPTQPRSRHPPDPMSQISLGPRPYWLVDAMDPSPLKDKLASCAEQPMRRSTWSIAHRGGGTLMIPEETRESILAGARMGAGVHECDVSFTADRQLVCRHAMCDLHTTTDIVAVPSLNAKCTQPFEPADPAAGTPATARCCTSDITLADFRSLCGKMDGANASALDPAAYLRGTPPYRTDLYAGPGTCARVLSHRDFLDLVRGLAGGRLLFTPELKTPEVAMPFGDGGGSGGDGGSDYTQAAYAQQLVDEYRDAGIDPSRVLPQSFLLDDVLYWLAAEPAFGARAILLDQSAPDAARLEAWAARGVRAVAPPLGWLVDDAAGVMVPSAYAVRARELGLDLYAWSLERSGWLGDGSHGGDYYATVAGLTNGEGDVYNLLHVLAQDVGVKGVFSDWSATVTYYANCFGLGLED